MICWHACCTAAPQQPTVPGAIRVLGDRLFLRNQRNHFVEYNFESHHKVVGEVKDTKPKSGLLGTKRLPALQSWFKRWKALIFKGCRRNASRALAISHTVLSFLHFLYKCQLSFMRASASRLSVLGYQQLHNHPQSCSEQHVCPLK